MGKVSGKLGNLIIYQRNGKGCFRTKPAKISVPPSAKQIYQRKAFSLVSSFLAPIRHDLEFGFSAIPGENSKRVGKAISLAVKKAVINETGVPVLHPHRVQVSMGDLLAPVECEVSWIEDNAVQIKWRPNSFEGNGVDGDQLFYVGYNPSAKHKWSVRGGAYRSSGEMKVQFPWQRPLEGKFYHYVSFYSLRKGRVEFSDSVCLGMT